MASRFRTRSAPKRDPSQNCRNQLKSAQKTPDVRVPIGPSTPPCNDTQQLIKEIERNPTGSRFDAGSHTGMLFDADGNRMTPTHAVKKGARYRYYVSRPLITKEQSANSGVGVDRRALCGVGMIDVRQDRRRLRVLYDRADLALDEVGRRVVLSFALLSIIMSWNAARNCSPPRSHAAS